MNFFVLVAVDICSNLRSRQFIVHSDEILEIGTLELENSGIIIVGVVLDVDFEAGCPSPRPCAHVDACGDAVEFDSFFCARRVVLGCGFENRKVAIGDGDAVLAAPEVPLVPFFADLGFGHVLGAV